MVCTCDANTCKSQHLMRIYGGPGFLGVCPFSSLQPAGMPFLGQAGLRPSLVNLDGQIPRLPTCAMMGNLIWYQPQFPMVDEHRAQSREAPGQARVYTSRFYY